MEYLAIETKRFQVTKFYVTEKENVIHRNESIFTLQEGGAIYHVEAKRIVEVVE